MTKLLINIDHVATLRNARRERFPDPVEIALACERSGADGIVFHLREDRRHIKDDDVHRLKAAIRSKLDFECSLANDVIDICSTVCPDLTTLVPERREEITTEGGIDVLGNRKRISTTVERLFGAGIPEIALFVDPDHDQLRAAADTGVNAIELHTGDYANAAHSKDRTRALDALASASELANNLGLSVHAGHGLDYENYADFRNAMPFLSEVSIGFAIIARSLMVGMPDAVRSMKNLVDGPRSGSNP
jgi:pyridoxine 5-phosphate synthase